MKKLIVMSLLLLLVVAMASCRWTADGIEVTKTEHVQDSIHTLRATNLVTGLIVPITVPAANDVYTVGDSVWVYIDETDSRVRNFNREMVDSLRIGNFVAFRIEEDVCAMRSPEENAHLDSVLRAVEQKYLQN